jgi:hypothetical protein
MRARRHPLPINAGAVQSAMPDSVVNVRHRGGALAAGIAFGLLGAAIANNYAYPPPYFYYSPYPAYYPPYPYYGPYWGYRPYVPWGFYRPHRYRR